MNRAYCRRGDFAGQWRVWLDGWPTEHNCLFLSECQQRFHVGELDNTDCTLPIIHRRELSNPSYHNVFHTSSPQSCNMAHHVGFLIQALDYAQPFISQ